MRNFLTICSLTFNPAKGCNIIRFMKKIFVFALVALLASMTMNAQNQVMKQEKADDVIAVVGYFSKNDTMTYRLKHYKNKIQGNDTTVSESYVEKFMLVVTDSTSKGYKMKYIPQSFSLRDTTLRDTGTPTSQMAINAIALRQLMQSVVCEFTTDEKGSLKSITNWREISDQLMKGVKATCDNLYATIPDLDTTNLRQQLGVILAFRFGTEEGVRNSYMELENLFGLYGSTCDIGYWEEETEDHGYPQLISTRVDYTTIEDEGDDLDDGDYTISRQLTLTIPFEEVMDVGYGSLPLKVSEMVNDSLEANPNGAEVIVSDLYGFLFFKNGWLKKFLVEEEIDLGFVKSVEVRYIECTTRK